MFPTPEDLGDAPAWDNYVVAQVVQATLGLIPRGAVAVGVEVEKRRVRLHFHLSQVSEEDLADIKDVVEDLDALLGGVARLEVVRVIRERRDISSEPDVRWIYLARE
jgi:hypothetical protein